MVILAGRGLPSIVDVDLRVVLLDIDLFNDLVEELMLG